MRMTTGGAAAALLLLVSWGGALSARAADEDIRTLVKRLEAEIEVLRKEKAASKPIGPGTIDKIVNNKYGPNASVTTHSGKLTIGGLLQVWYTGIQNDNRGVFGDVTPGAPGGGDTNEAKDNDSFRIRRTELKFSMDIHENVRGVVMIDPSRNVGTFPSFNTNLGAVHKGISSGPGALQTGAGKTAHMLQDAFILFHGVVPHHDFKIGQFKKPGGEEGLRSSAKLDFPERSMIGQLSDTRDIGLTMHGFWWENRFQYWLGVFNGPGNLFGTAGQFQNRSDDNDAKDFVYRILLRPLWKDETWGSLELGGGSQIGRHGEAGNPGAGNVDGLNRRRTWAFKNFAWAMYKPGGPVQGWWLRGEWLWIKDRNVPGAVTGFTAGLPDPAVTQTAPNPVSISGWYASTGYRISDSIWADKVPAAFKPFEFVFRYETFQNIMAADLIRPQQRTDVFATNIFSAGINYYIKGHDAKIQAAYNWVNEPNNAANNRARTLREVRNDNFIISFQVHW